MKPWTTLERRPVLTQGRYLTVELHRVQLPGGRVIPDWPWLITPDFTTVVAQTADGRFLCFRQTKYAVAGVALAPAGGFLEPGEAPLAGAQRELLEETGHTAPEWHALGEFAVDGNRGAGRCYAFLARGAVPAPGGREGDLEEQEMVRLTRAAVDAALDRGEFKVLPWVAAMALGLRCLDGLKPRGGGA